MKQACSLLQVAGFSFTGKAICLFFAKKSMQQFAPWLGYLASLCLVISLIVNNDLKFRWFNTLGCVFFIMYGFVLKAWPVFITNAILFGINLWYLVAIYYRKEMFDIFEFRGNEQMALKFLQYYEKDIAAYFPECKQEGLQQQFNFVVTRDLVIANMFSARIDGNGDAIVLLNYTLKKYRDYKVGRYIFEKEKDFLLAKGVKRVVYNDVFNKNHKAFLLRMGFVLQTEGSKEILAKKIAL